MTIRIVTDSASDIPSEVAQKLGISIVPLTVSFGKEVYRDGIDLNAEEFYSKLVQGKTHPVTSQPSIGNFIDVYKAIARKGDEIISIHLSSKLSGTYNAASQAKEAMTKDCRIEVVDSKSVSMGTGLTVIAAAKAIRDGASFQQVIDIVHHSIPRIHLLAFFQTLEYLERGGRLGKGKALLGTLLHVKPIIIVRDGEVQPFGKTRTRMGALRCLYNFAESLLHIRELSIMYTTIFEEVKILASLLNPIFPQARILTAQVGSTLGTHTGPGTLA
ncbi:MAG: DegV family protein, partial [Dehalococcoidia bacterium]|nr:DegV family protein [Dehalococcoidia bacterium]